MVLWQPFDAAWSILLHIGHVMVYAIVWLACLSHLSDLVIFIAWLAGLINQIYRDLPTTL